MPAPAADARTMRGRTAIAAVCVALLAALCSPLAGRPGATVASAAPAAEVPEWIPGIDVASHQHPGGAPIDWAAVARSGQRFAMVKATEGTTYRNPYHASDSYEARRVGIYVGSYHYARPKHPVDSSARAEARFFAANMGDPNAPGVLQPVLDLEEHGGLGPADLTRWTRVFLAELQGLTGKLPIIYTGTWFWNTHVGATGFSGYPLWLANYTSAPAPSSIPRGWPNFTIWQWTSSGSVPGIVGRVDLNRFAGGEAAFQAFLQGRLGRAPIGSVDLLRVPAPGKVRVAGWAIDPDSPITTIPVHVYVGRVGTALAATGHRPDIARIHGAINGAGYDATLDLPPGRHEVCVYAIEAFGGGGNTRLGCETVGGDPLGGIGSVTAGPGGGQVRVTGWAVDPETASPIPVHVYVGSRGTAITADAPSDGAPAGFVGPHGFSTVVEGDPGRRDVCIAAINAPGTPGATTWLGCRSVVVPTGDAVGHVDLLRQHGPGRIQVAGWAFDPDDTSPGAVHAYVDGRGSAISASGLRHDVSARFSHDGPTGFIARLTASPGANHVCVASINAAGTLGTSTWLTCRNVTVRSGSPFGSVDLVTSTPEGIRVAGWAADPETDDPIEVHVYVDGRGVATTARGHRPDVAAVTGWAPTRSFDLTVPAGRGSHEVCVAAINAPGTPGGPTWLTCRTVSR